MNRPQKRLVARLLEILPDTCKVWPLIVPQRESYPAVVYQVVGNEPQDDSADSGSQTRQMKIRVACLAKTEDGVRGYQAAWELADAVLGDSDDDAPSGVDGWTDPQGDLWQLSDSLDEVQEIASGRDQFECWCVNLFFQVTYCIAD